MRKIIIFLNTLLICATAYATDPTATKYTYTQCQGSAMPYPTPDVTLRAIPDSLTPIFINHIGRHGARFLSSSKYTTTLNRYLSKADSLGSITPAGRKLRKLCAKAGIMTAGRWGALDSLGMAEQRGIASRLYMLTPELFNGAKINAISSYVPRCIASMDEFTHQLSRLNNKIEIYTASGRQNSPLLRPWTNDNAYKEYINGNNWREVYDNYFDDIIPSGIATKILGKAYPFTDGEEHDVAMTVYKFLAGCAAFSLEADISDYLTIEEFNALWSINNLHNYLTHSASTLSPAPMEMAAALLNDMIETMEQAAKGTNEYTVMLRFGHAETLIPLFALMRLTGCYYMTNYFDTVGLHWCNFRVVPMAANLQMILFKSKSGKLYVRTDLNETPIPLIPGRNNIYTPWENAKEYLTRCLPLYLQI